MSRSRVESDVLAEPPPGAAGAIAVARGSGTMAVKVSRLTVLFADLRGYTGLAERLSPGCIVPLLDEFFGMLANVTEQHGGRVYHMAGDGMMAGFGVDDPAQNGAHQALAAGHAMLAEFSQLGARWQRDVSIAMGIGVGLHLGEVALGLLGPPGRKQTTLVGDTVNVAARLCGRARSGELLLSCTVAAALDVGRLANGIDPKPTAFLQLPQFELRGRTAPLDIWCVPAAKRLAL